MWIKSHSMVFPDLQKEKVWQLWADINHYTRWHSDLDYCKLIGDFVVGNHFMLKPKGAPAVRVDIIELIKYKKFTDCTSFFGAKMFDIHELEETSAGLLIRNTIKVTGPLSFLWVNLVAKKVAASSPAETTALVELARRSFE